jgi:hypothetical protein
MAFFHGKVGCLISNSLNITQLVGNNLQIQSKCRSPGWRFRASTYKIKGKSGILGMVFEERSHGKRKRTAKHVSHDLVFGHMAPPGRGNKLYPPHEIIVITILAVIATCLSMPLIWRRAART